MKKKILLLYVGYGYPDYEDWQIDKIANQSGATDFVFTTANEVNFCQKNESGAFETIIKSSYIDDVPNSCYGVTSLSYINEIKQGMVSTINFYNSYTPDTYEHDPTYKNYIQCAVNLAKKIVQRKKDAKLWFGFPPMLAYHSGSASTGGNVTVLGEYYNYYYKEFIFYPVYEALKTQAAWNNPAGANYGDNTFVSIWDTNVEGYYYGQEDLPLYYTCFHENNESTDYDNNVVKNMHYMSDLVHNIIEPSERGSKKLLWIPYIVNNSNDHVVRQGTIVNRKNYFDYAIFQPSYFWHENTNNLSQVTAMVNQNKALYSNNEIIGGSKISNTEIGAEMEVSPKYFNGSTSEPASNYQSRFANYVDHFKQFLEMGNEKNLGFYADGPNGMIGGTRCSLNADATFPLVKKFFNFGK